MAAITATNTWNLFCCITRNSQYIWLTYLVDNMWLIGKSITKHLSEEVKSFLVLMLLIIGIIN